MGLSHPTFLPSSETDVPQDSESDCVCFQNSDICFLILFRFTPLESSSKPATKGGGGDGDGDDEVEVGKVGDP